MVPDTSKEWVRLTGEEAEVKISFETDVIDSVQEVYDITMQEVQQATFVKQPQVKKHEEIVRGRAEMWEERINHCLEASCCDYRISFKVEDGVLYFGIEEDFLTKEAKE